MSGPITPSRLRTERALKEEMESSRRLNLLTWADMVKFCPALADLKTRFHAWSSKNTNPDEDTMQWSRWIKPEMREMVGWYSRQWPRDHPMTSTQAWDIAHREIFLLAPMGWKKNG